MNGGLPNGPSRPKVLLTHRVHASVFERLRVECEIDHNDTGHVLPHDEVRRRSRDATAIMTFMTDRIDRHFLDDCPKLRIVAGAFKGFDNIDVAACTERGVWVTRVRDLLTVPTAELAIGLLLALTRNVVTGDRLMRREPFQGWRPILYGAGLTGKRLGIYGMGAVGQAIAQRMAGFEVHVVYYDPHRLSVEREEALGVRWAPFDDLLAECNYLIVAAPLTDENLHAFDDVALSRMQDGAFLVNVGRGSVVEEQAVARALQAGKLAGFAADVYEMEDQSRPDRPMSISRELLSLPDRTVFTPHLGSAVASVREQIELEAADNILAVVCGEEPPGAVNQPV